MKFQVSHEFHPKTERVFFHRSFTLLISRVEIINICYANVRHTLDFDFSPLLLEKQCSKKKFLVNFITRDLYLAFGI